MEIFCALIFKVFLNTQKSNTSSLILNIYIYIYIYIYIHEKARKKRNIKSESIIELIQKAIDDTNTILTPDDRCVGRGYAWQMQRCRKQVAW